MKNCCLAGLGLVSGAQKEVLCQLLRIPALCVVTEPNGTQSGPIRASPTQLATSRCHVAGPTCASGLTLPAQQLTFRCKDGSVDDGTAVFTQRGDFHLITERHIQKAPSFPHPMDLSIDAHSGQVTVRS
ncbi:MAG: hypothetical protein QOE55_6933 [Acidobacteriaceae bacterium]|nr:hypothetical protein [Acidobacteriaceae bacterium]